MNRRDFLRGTLACCMTGPAVVAMARIESLPRLIVTQEEADRGYLTNAAVTKDSRGGSHNRLRNFLEDWLVGRLGPIPVEAGRLEWAGPMSHDYGCKILMGIAYSIEGITLEIIG